MRLILFSCCIGVLFSCTWTTNETKQVNVSERNNDVAYLDKQMENEPYLKKIFTQYHFSIQYPASWEVDTNETRALLICKANCNPDLRFCANFVVNALSKKEGVSLEGYVSAFLQETPNRFEKFKIVNVDTVKINGLQSVIMDYKMFSNETHLGGTTAFVVIEENIIVNINCMGENQQEGAYIKYREIFDQIIKSVKPI